MLKLTSIAFVFTLFLPNLFASDFPNYKVGSGSEFELSLKNVKTKLIVTIAAQSPGRLVTEYYFNSPGLVAPMEMWQQFHLQKSAHKNLKITKGFFYTHQTKAPQPLPKENLQGTEALPIDGFMIQNPKDIQKFFIAKEKVSTPAGSVSAAHYRVSTGTQTIDFWISDQAKPIGLVQLKSTGTKPDQNFGLKLKQLVSNVKRKIDPKKAVPLTEQGRSFLQLNKVGRLKLN